jgi:hypothetical protein
MLVVVNVFDVLSDTDDGDDVDDDERIHEEHVD